MKKRILSIAILTLCALLVFAVSAIASDFGGFAGDDDYGGGSDFGGDSSWGGTSDYSSDGFSCVGDFGLTEIIIVIVIIVILAGVFGAKNKGKGGSRGPVAPGAQRTDASALLPIEQYAQNIDNDFDPAQMQSKLSNLYVQLQNCWQARDIEPLRPYLTDMMYSQSERQLDEMRRANQTPHIERIAVLDVKLRGYYQRDEQDHIIAEIYARIVTYVTDDNSGAIVRGDKNAEKFMTYEWDMCRATGVKTGERKEMENVHCPSCGAPVAINQTAKCPYCDSIITVKEHDWALSSIKGIQQRTQ